MLNILELQQQLTAVALPSGFEAPQAALLESLARPLVDDIRRDAIGNLYCHKKGPGKKLMFIAHMDVIGFLITFVDDRGFLRFEPIGGHTPAALVGAAVRLESGACGTVRADATADVTRHDWQAVDIHDLYIDIGACDRAEAEEKAPIGSVAVFDAQPVEAAEGTLLTPYADDLSACIALLRAMELLKDGHPENDLTFVFSVQEEVGLRGAKPAAWTVQPDLAIALDVTATGDTPGEQDGQRMQVSLGHGPTVKIKDSGVECDRQAVEHLRRAAADANIVWQDEILLAGSTDTAVVQKTRSGILSGCISIPCRNIHTPGEIVSLTDVEQAAVLVAAAAQLAL